MSTRVPLGRVPLRPRHVNVEKGSSSSSSSSSSSKPSLRSYVPLTKPKPLLERGASSGSGSGSVTRSGSRSNSLASVDSSNNENNRACSSIALSSDALMRQAMDGGVAVAPSSNANANANVNDGGNTSTVTETGHGGAPGAIAGGGSKAANVNENAGAGGRKGGLKRISSSSSVTRGKDNTSEPVTIFEHRKRPSGDGHTVHKYLKGKLLGKGGFAKVYKVTSLDTNKEYAVKIVPKANLAKARARQKLQTEIKIHRTMKHENICEYKHFFEDKTNCYILLELCHNQSMNEMIKRRKGLTEEEVRYFMAQLVDSMSFMHEANVIHRDLKLGNLFLNKQLNMKVGDFGLATKLASSDEKRKTICGTPNYIAPEVIDGSNKTRGHSFEVDIWSMGVVCYTLLVGKPPYESNDVKSTYKRILANQYSFPQGLVSIEARSLISSMLKTDPSARPSLAEIRRHPFFTHGRTPSSLPTSCAFTTPVWAIDEFGELFAKPTVSRQKTLEEDKKPSLSKGRRQPLSKKNSNTNNAPALGILPQSMPPQIKRVGAGAHRSTQPARPHVVHARPHAVAPIPAMFSIYDDLNDDAKIMPLPQLASLSSVDMNRCAAPAAAELRGHPSTYDECPVNKLAVEVAECCLDEEEISPPEPTPTHEHMFPGKSPAPTQGQAGTSVPAAAASMPPSSETAQCKSNCDDIRQLEVMHDRLRDCLDQCERVQKGEHHIVDSPSSPLMGDEVGGATKWVTRYVDYTSKYGLGFLLNDGSSGVYFNDSTKAVLAPADDDFVYVERKKVGAEGTHEPVGNYTLSSYPEDTLKKKVTLLKHFRTYLLEQQKRAEETGEAEPLTSICDEGQVSGELVYLKKWIRMKHAMMFRLSNGTVQVVFYDHTEVLMSSEGKLITYVDKERGRFTHSIADIASQQQTEISRRLKYAKEILYQLISGSQKR